MKLTIFIFTVAATLASAAPVIEPKEVEAAAKGPEPQGCTTYCYPAGGTTMCYCF
jgi:hypothetical protein